jgi:GT2 family glycosyltransferase
MLGSPVNRIDAVTIQGYFDMVRDAGVYGWVYDDNAPAKHICVEAVAEDGRIVGTALANMFRGDLLTAGCGVGGCCAFKIELIGNLADYIGRRISVRPAGTDMYLAGGPQTVTLNPNLHSVLTRGARVKPILRQLRVRLDREAKGAISIIMPVFNTPQKWLVEALESVRAQWCGHWELICINDASTSPHVAPILAAYARSDPRIRVFTCPINEGIAHATNIGLRAARHSYVAFFDHDDYLEPHAVWRLLRAAHKTGADLIYSDELVTSESIDHILDVRMRPAFSHDYYLSHPYFVHLLCVRRDVAHQACGFDETMHISADVDFVLRVIEQAQTVAHIPAALYRWRTHGGSAGHTNQAAVTSATVAAIQRHLARLGTKAVVSAGVSFNQYRVDWPAPRERTLIVVPTKNGVDLLRKCVQSIERTVDPDLYSLVVIDHQSDDKRTRHYLRNIAARHIVMPYAGPFNFAHMNNLAVRRHGKGCRFVLFMNNDVEAIHPGWLVRLMSLAARRDIGAVGPALIFSDRRIQHAGVIIGYGDAAEHVGKALPLQSDEGERTHGSNCILTSVRDSSAVTGACLLTRRSVFNAVHGFRKELPVAFNDTDLCLRLREHGMRVLYDGNTVLYHHESVTRAQTNDLVHPKDTERFYRTWRHMMHGADPFYHPSLSLTVADHILREELVVPQVAARVIAPSFAFNRRRA